MYTSPVFLASTPQELDVMPSREPTAKRTLPRFTGNKPIRVANTGEIKGCGDDPAHILRRELRNRGNPDVVALRQFLERGTVRAALPGLCLLLWGEFRGTAHVLPASLRPAPSFRRAGTDQETLLAVYAYKICEFFC